MRLFVLAAGLLAQLSFASGSKPNRDLKDNETRRNRLEERRTGATQTISGLNPGVGASSAAYREAARQAEQAERELASIARESARLERQKERAQQRLQDSRTDLDDRTGVVTDLKSVQAQVAALETRLTNVDASIGTATQALRATLEARLKEHEDSLNELKAEKPAEQTPARDVVIEIARLSIEHGKGLQALSKFSALSDEVRKDQKKLDSIRDEVDQTLMGQYVNSRIAETLKSKAFCDAIAQAKEGKCQDFAGAVNTAMGKDRTGFLIESSGQPGTPQTPNGNHGAPATPPTTPPAGAGVRLPLNQNPGGFPGVQSLSNPDDGIPDYIRAPAPTAPSGQGPGGNN